MSNGQPGMPVRTQKAGREPLKEPHRALNELAAVRHGAESHPASSGLV